jgi:triacylglycerol lipase
MKKPIIVFSMIIVISISFATVIGVQCFSIIYTNKTENKIADPIESIDSEEDINSAQLLDKDPVIFVHGIIGGYGLTPFDTMRTRLLMDGWGVNDLFEIYYRDPIFASNVDNAMQLAAYVQYVRAITGHNQVDIVTHSMGGLSARYYIKFLGGAAFVDDLVTLGAPHHGTIMAMTPISLLSLGGMECAPGSPFLTALNMGDETPGFVDYTCLYSMTDEMIQPYLTATLIGATNRGVFLCGHVGLLSNPTLYYYTREAIRY